MKGLFIVLGGLWGCRENNMYNASIYCTGAYRTCYGVSIYASQNIYFLSSYYQTFVNGRIFSNGVTDITGNPMNVYFLSYDSEAGGDSILIYCNQTDTCNIYCGTNNVSSDGMWFVS